MEEDDENDDDDDENSTFLLFALRLSFMCIDTIIRSLHIRGLISIMSYEELHLLYVCLR